MKFTYIGKVRNAQRAIYFLDQELNEDDLFESQQAEWQEIDKDIRRQAEIGKGRLKILLIELIQEEKELIDIRQPIVADLNALLVSKTEPEPQRRLNINNKEEQHRRVVFLITHCQDTIGYLLDLIVTYWIDGFKNENLITLFRKYFPVYHLKRQMVEAYLQNEHKNTIEPKLVKASTGRPRRTPCTKTLPEIWQEPYPYNTYQKILALFVEWNWIKKEGEIYTWRQTTHHKAIASCFIGKLIEKGWVQTGNTNSDWSEIFYNTFNVKISSDYFKPAKWDYLSLKSDYVKRLSGLPKNQ